MAVCRAWVCAFLHGAAPYSALLSLVLRQSIIVVAVACESTPSDEWTSQAWHKQLMNEPDMQGGAAVSKM